MIEKRPQDVPPKIERRIGMKLQSTQRTAFVDLLPVMPRAHHQKDFVIAGVFRLDGFIDGNRAVDVFLVPETMDQHHGDLQRFFCQELVDGLLAPE